MAIELVNVKCPMHEEELNQTVLFECPPNNWAQEVSLTVVECECGLIFFNPNLSMKTRRAYHSKDYFIANERGCVGYPDYLEEGHADAKKYFGKLIFSWISRCWEDPDRLPNSILDIGSAVGFMSKPFLDKGWRTVGIEFSEWAARWGREHLGIDIRCQDFDNLFLNPEEIFDCVMLWDSFEHAQNPRQLLREIWTHTSRKPLLIVQSPNVDEYRDDPIHPFWSLYQHCFHYNPETLQRIFELEGFEIVRKIPSTQPAEMLFIFTKKRES